MHDVRNQRGLKTIRLFALAALLVLSQFALIQHEVADLAQQVGGTHCHWCMAGNSLHAAVGSAGWWPTDLYLLRFNFVPHVDLIDRFFIAAYSSRAPPTLS